MGVDLSECVQTQWITWVNWFVDGGGAAKPAAAAGGENPGAGEGAGGAHQRPRARV